VSRLESSSAKRSEFSCSPSLHQHAMEIGNSEWGLRLEIDIEPCSICQERGGKGETATLSLGLRCRERELRDANSKSALLNEIERNKHNWMQSQSLNYSK
jgi:hypothetical protein